MSWLGYKSKSLQDNQTDSREEKRKKLETARKERDERRNQLQKHLKQAQIARQEAEQILQEFCDIALDLSDNDTPIDNSEVDIEDIIIDPAVTMVNFDEDNKENGDDAMKNLGQIKVKWNAENPDFFFAQLETELQIFSILKQFTKRQALIRSLPEEICIGIHAPDMLARRQSRQYGSESIP